MFGIVLWSDASQQKAVIWCEDQGDLAFIDDHGSSSACFGEIEAGDMVEFDLDTQSNLRLASNLRTVQQMAHPCLADYLTDVQSSAEPVVANNQGSNVIPFRPLAREGSPELPVSNAG